MKNNSNIFTLPSETTIKQFISRLSNLVKNKKLGPDDIRKMYPAVVDDSDDQENVELNETEMLKVKAAVKINLRAKPEKMFKSWKSLMADENDGVAPEVSDAKKKEVKKMLTKERNMIEKKIILSVVAGR